MPNSPIVVFAFNRPAHLSRLLESLRLNDAIIDSQIYLYIDGPRDETDNILVNEVFKVAQNFGLNHPLIIKKSQENMGLAASILRGLNELFEMHDTLIVLEDDLVLGRHFLDFCNDGLKKYKDNHEIGSIQGYSLIEHERDKPYFLRGADCWGWATWKDRWELFCSDSKKLLSTLEKSNQSFEFDLRGSYPYTNMLRREAQGEVNSWAIRWHASMFLHNKISLYPGKSLVENAGFDGSGTHYSSGDHLISQPTNKRIEMPKQDPRVEEKIFRKIIQETRRRYRIYPYYHPFKYVYAFKRRFKIKNRQL